jgi:hypothetical protein
LEVVEPIVLAAERRRDEVTVGRSSTPAKAEA